ncbi:MAG TPA: hypothetical protein VEC60_10280 [Reyranella sp.]|nr:hypothetical protein [Reyranella sp.]
MPRRAKRQTRNHESNSQKQPQATSNGTGVWVSKPGANLSLLLSRVRAAQVRRLHFR